MKEAAVARFDARISVKQKKFFEYAAALSGYKTLAAFIFHAAEVEAEKIIEKHIKFMLLMAFYLITKVQEGEKPL